MAGQIDWKGDAAGEMPVGCHRGEQKRPSPQRPKPCINTPQDQWNQFTVHQVGSQPYGRPLSTVFVDASGHLYDEDNDPTIASLHFLDYRYMRFCYHPIQDKFLLINGWKDPSWTNVKVMRGGLDADERDSREQIFGQNNIDIQQKNVPQLLIDEVRDCFWFSHALVL